MSTTLTRWAPVLSFARRSMDHATAQELFSSYVEGDLPADKRKDLDDHLGACIQCRTGLASFKRALGGLGALKSDAPPAFLSGIQQQIHRRSRGRFFANRWKLFGRIPFEWVSLTMILAMLVYYIVVLQTSPTGVRPVP